MSEAYVVLGFRDGDVRAFRSADYHQKTEEKHPDVQDWVWGTTVEDAKSPTHAAFKARTTSVLEFDEAMKAAAFLMSEYLDLKEWEVDKDGLEITAENLELLHELIVGAGVESPFQGMAKWERDETVTWVEEGDEWPRSEGWKRSDECDDSTPTTPGQLEMAL